MSSILAEHRAEQSAALQKGLTLSAGIHLTLAVLLFGVLGLVRTLPPPPPQEEDPVLEHRVLDPDVFDDFEAGAPPRQDVVDVPPDVADIEPVEVEDRIIDDPLPPARDTDGPTPNDGVTGISRGTGSGGVSGNGGEEVDPDPNVPDFSDIQPEAIHRALPIYPDVMRQAGVEGKVVVRVLVGKQGEVRRVEIESSSAAFDEVALEAARQWTFRPAIAQGRPVAVWVRIPFVFRMK